MKKKSLKPKICAIVQARMTSTRLPGKVLMEIEGKPMVWHVVHRLGFCQQISDIVLAIPDTKENDALERFSIDNKIKYFRGSEEDVLSRYYETAKKFGAEFIVRITSDCPLIDPRVVDLVIEKHFSSDADYTSNWIDRTFPRGLDIEIFSLETLEKTNKEAMENYQREHVTPYIYENPSIFKIQNVEAEGRLKHPEIRLTVDTDLDLNLIRKIFDYLGSSEIFYTEQVINLLKEHLELLKINSVVEQKKLE